MCIIGKEEEEIFFYFHSHEKYYLNIANRPKNFVFIQTDD